MNFADALDAALERGTYESTRATRSAATFTSRHANPFLYSPLGGSFAQRRVFSGPALTVDAGLRDAASTAFTSARPARRFDSGDPKERAEEGVSGSAATAQNTKGCQAETESTTGPRGGDAARDGEQRAEGVEPMRTRRRMLTAVERRALDTFAWHGARLTPEFSVSELRREYRRLARRFHPDAHPECTPDELAGMSAQFAAVSASYQTLLSVG